MDITFVIAALLGGAGVAAVVVTVYLGVQKIERQQELILERLSDLSRRLDER